MQLVEKKPECANQQGRILLLDDDRIILDSLSEFLDMEGYHVSAVDSFEDAREILGEGEIQVAITDLNMPNVDGLEFLRYLTANHPQVTAIVITAYGSIESAVEAIKLGAHDYLTKPVIDDELRMSIQRALKQQALQAENIELKNQLKRHQQFGNIIGQDKQMHKVFSLIRAVASTPTNVLITGESGTGKSMVARTIHQQSDRRDGPFVEVSCGALPENLLESELFGHIKGSFTGALSDKQGRFLAADGGTIFLDEIDSATPSFQVKLLRVLQERQFEPVGTNKTVRVNVRVIVATNKNLKKLVEEEKFREDLYYRVNVVDIHLPPLRERVSDIGLLANHFLDKFGKIHNRSDITISSEAMKFLARHSWPGNVRELENVIERAVVLSLGGQIGTDDLPTDISEPACNDTIINPNDTLAEVLLKSEKKIILSALERYNGNRQKTAKALGISRTSLFRKIRDLEIK